MSSIPRPTGNPPKQKQSEKQMTQQFQKDLSNYGMTLDLPEIRKEIRKQAPTKAAATNTLRMFRELCKEEGAVHLLKVLDLHRMDPSTTALDLLDRAHSLPAYTW